MARIKNYEMHIANITQEIKETEEKLANLNSQLDTLRKEKEEHDVNALYKYIRANNISINDIAKTLNSDVVDSDDVSDVSEVVEKTKTTKKTKNENGQTTTKTTAAQKRTSNKQKVMEIPENKPKRGRPKKQQEA